MVLRFGQKSAGKAAGKPEDVTALIAKKNYARAIEVIKEQLKAPRAAEPRLRMQLADVLVLAGKSREAVMILTPLSDEFAREGFAAKAIAVLKKIQKIDPSRREVEEKLAGLIQEKQQQASVVAAPPAPALEIGMEEIGFEPSSGGSIPAPVETLPVAPESAPVETSPAAAPEPAPRPQPAAPPAPSPPPPAAAPAARQFEIEEAGIELEVEPLAEPAPVTPPSQPPERPVVLLEPQPLPILEPSPTVEPEAVVVAEPELSLAPEVEFSVAPEAEVSLLPEPEQPLALEPELSVAPEPEPPIAAEPEALPATGEPEFVLDDEDELALDQGGPPVEVAPEAAEAELEAEPEPAMSEPVTDNVFVDELMSVLEEAFPSGLEAPFKEPIAPASSGSAQIVVSPLFRHFSVDEMVAVIAGLNLLSYERGQVILREGDPGHSLFMLSSGKVKAFRKNAQGKQVPLAVLEEGAFFGEGSILTGKPRAASVVALESCELLELDRPTLDSIVQRHPHVMDVMREFAAERAVGN